MAKVVQRCEIPSFPRRQESNHFRYFVDLFREGDSIGKTGLANGAAQQCRSVGKIAQMLFYLEEGLGQLGQIPGTVPNIDRQHISALGR